MYRFNVLFFLFCFLFSSAGFSQATIKMANAKPYDEDRYKDFKGEPYLWEQPKEVTIWGVNQDPIAGVMGNYNLVEGQFEIYQDDKFIIINKLEYPKIVSSEVDGESTTLLAVMHPKLSFGYCIEHYNEDQFLVLEQRKRLKSSVVVETPGKTERMQKLKNSKKVYALKSGQLFEIKSKTKKIIKQFGHKKEIKDFVKANKLKLKNVKDLVTLLKYLNENEWVK